MATKAAAHRHLGLCLGKRRTPAERTEVVFQVKVRERQHTQEARVLPHGLNRRRPGLSFGTRRSHRLRRLPFSGTGSADHLSSG